MLRPYSPVWLLMSLYCVMNLVSPTFSAASFLSSLFQHPSTPNSGLGIHYMALEAASFALRFVSHAVAFLVPLSSATASSLYMHCLALDVALLCCALSLCLTHTVALGALTYSLLPPLSYRFELLHLLSGSFDDPLLCRSNLPFLSPLFFTASYPHCFSLPLTPALSPSLFVELHATYALPSASSSCSTPRFACFRIRI